MLEAIQHGTPAGFTAGCRTIHCPAALPCKDVHRRYSGDWGFKKQIDAGATLEEILQREAEEAARIKAERLKAARRPRPKVAPRQTSDRTMSEISDLHRTVAGLLGQGLTDLQVGERIGKTRVQVRHIRRYLGLPINAVQFNLPDRVRALHAEGLTDTQIAQRLGNDRGHVSRVRRTLRLPRNVHLNVNPDRVAELHATGLTDNEIAAEMGVERSSVTKYRRRLELAPNPARRE